MVSSLKRGGGVLFKLIKTSLEGLIVSIVLLAFTTSLVIADQEKQGAKNYAESEETGEYVRNRFLQRIKKPFERTDRKKALIIGDSHAQDFFNGVLENGFLNNYQISTRYIPTRCQIYLGRNMAKFLEADDRQLCSKSDNLIKAKSQIKQADLIILVASWREWAAKEIPQTIRNMRLVSSQKLVVIGRKSFSKSSINNYQQLSRQDLINARNQVDVNQLSINSLMSSSLSDRIFVNFHQLICGTSESCPVFTDRLKQISFDGGHFSKDGARYITKLLFQRSQLGSL